MDSSEAAELIAELHEDRAEAEQNEKFRNAALMIAVLAAILAIGGLRGLGALLTLNGFLLLVPLPF